MTSFKMNRSDFLAAVAFMSGDDALETADESYPFADENLYGANLEDANLEDANLRDANLRDANLRGANLEDANLEDANLEDANLEGANLRDANLRDANLRGANLRGANLYGANLYGANLCGANLRDANLRDANLRGANLRGANLRGAKKIAAIYVPGMSSRGDFLYAVAGETILFKAGCFWGSAEDLRAKVIAQKGDSKSARLYLASIDLIILALSDAE